MAAAQLTFTRYANDLKELLIRFLYTNAQNILLLIFLRTQRFQMLNHLTIILLNIRPKRLIKDNTIQWVIFSFDRPMQLEALLKSFSSFHPNETNVHILFRASPGSMDSAYAELIHEFKHSQYSFIREANFKKDLMSILHGSCCSMVSFLVDDIIFLAPMPLKSAGKLINRGAVYSPRLGIKTQYSYASRVNFPTPSFISENAFPNLSLWKWNQGMVEWNYPISLDGHIFLLSEFIAMAKAVTFESPNQLEAKLQAFLGIFLSRFGACMAKQQLINIPANKVQSDYPNRYGNISQEELLNLWNQGYRINPLRIPTPSFTSPHEELDLLSALEK